MSLSARTLRSVLDRLGLEFKRDNLYYKTQLPVEWSAEDRDLFAYIKDRELSMTFDRGLIATISACNYVVERGIEGDFVECGVWRGGNAIAAALIFKRYGVRKRVMLFDTFAGMTRPTSVDRQAHDGRAALPLYVEAQRETHNQMCYASLDEVRQNLREAGVPDENVTCVPGDVANTLADPDNLPERIAMLRLDTDWYESTTCELEVLYPRVSHGGVLVVDDYGHWTGAKQATDEYFERHGNRPFLQYLDYTGRLGIKV